MKKISIQQKQKIIQSYQSGIGSDTIAKKYNIHPNTVLKILAKNNVARRPIGNKTDPNLIVEYYKQGLSITKIAKKLHISGNTIKKALIENNVQIRTISESHRKYKINENFFDIIDTEEKAYFLGFLYADGYNCKKYNFINLSQEISDKDIIEKLSKLIYIDNAEKQIKYYDRSKENKSKVACLSINSKYMCEQLEKHGCMQGKTFLLKYPLLSNNLHRHFLRGYFDGDGSVNVTYKHKKGSKWKITSTKQFCEEVKKIIKKHLSIDINFYNYDYCKVYDLAISGDRNVILLLNWLYHDSNIYLQRKYNSYIELKNKIYYTNIQTQKGTKGYSKSKLTKTKDINFNLVFDNTLILNGHELTENYLQSLTEQERINLIIPIFKYFRKIGWRFPDKLTNVKTSYNNFLKNFDNISLNYICKYFCFSFYKVYEKEQLSIIDIFNDDNLLKQIIKNMLIKNTPISYKTLINEIYDFKPNNVQIYNASIIKDIYLNYSNQNDVVFDYCAGFGERMIVANYCNRKYVGIDPLTAPELIKMQNFLKIKNSEIYKQKSETFNKYQKNSVDLIWSDPPNYNEIHYSYKISQAYNKGEDYFYSIYWKNTLNNCKNMLKPNKWFGVHLSNNKKMLEMTINVFGNVKDKIKINDNEFIYMFINKK